MKFRKIFYIISLTLIAVSVFSIVKWGFRTSIDFSGGTNWEFVLPNNPSKEKIAEAFNQNNITLSSIDSNGKNNFTLKFANISTDQKKILDDSMVKIDKDYKELKFETLGPILGKELLRKTITAIILSSLFLLIFIGTRFKDFTFGAGAVLAMFHDSLILIGAFSILGHFFGAELDALFVTALLTTLASSVHDTVVTFDRMRELKRRNFKFDWVDLANQAVTETLTRSINNSMTIILMLLSLVMLGGSTTKWFATALLIGVICGTYSSTGVAIPLVLLAKKYLKKK
ncbi:MAG: protein translocase subunit SecF [Candidatus Shapirobacteria bacterium]